MSRKAHLAAALAAIVVLGCGGASPLLAQGTAPAPGGGGGPGKTGARGTTMFDRCDANGDGKVTLDEFQACHRNKAKAEKMFNNIDTNHDGAITRQEAQQWRAQRQGAGGGAGGRAKGPGGGAGMGPGGGSGMGPGGSSTAPGTGSGQ